MIDNQGGDYIRGRYFDTIPHYHGDVVRQIFIVGAALLLIGAPFYSSSLWLELPFEIIGALVLIALAALANPHQKTVFMLGAAASGAGLVIFQTWALAAFQESTWFQFALREVLAVLFLAGFYFCMKTVRAFLMHKIGKHDEAGEFDEE